MNLIPRSDTPVDRRRIKLMMRSIARQMRQGADPTLDRQDDAWMENRPALLMPLLEATVTASTAKKRDDYVIVAGRFLLANLLELIRYQFERGHDWARVILDGYQDQLIELAQNRTISEGDLFELANLLSIAKVPMRSELTTALTDASMSTTGTLAFSEQDLRHQLRGNIDQIAGAVETPFEVVEGLAETGALMPGEVRAFITHELGLSAHPIIREAVPLLLLDPTPEVRQAAVSVLNQIARPETFSSVMLRRTLLLRNWAPEPERPAIDGLIRKTRLNGVECAQWPPKPELTINCSVLDGSGSQSLILTTPQGRTGLFAGILLKQGFGVRDAWCSASLPRNKINSALRETMGSAGWVTVNHDFLDRMVQHHIARGLAMGNLPLPAAVEIAESIGASNWKGLRIEVADEIDELFLDLGYAAAGQDALAQSLRRSGRWLEQDPWMRSWFEDDATISDLAKQSKTPVVAVQLMLDDVLPGRREIWAERLFQMALWLRASDHSTPPEVWQDAVVLAHELRAGRKLSELPAMIVVAKRSISAAMDSF